MYFKRAWRVKQVSVDLLGCWVAVALFCPIGHLNTLRNTSQWPGQVGVTGLSEVMDAIILEMNLREQNWHSYRELGQMGKSIY